MSATCTCPGPTPSPTAPVGFCGVKGASRYTSLSVRTLWRYAAEGRIVRHRVGGRVLFSYVDLHTFITGESQESEP